MQKLRFHIAEVLADVRKALRRVGGRGRSRKVLNAFVRQLGKRLPSLTGRKNSDTMTAEALGIEGKEDSINWW